MEILSLTVACYPVQWRVWEYLHWGEQGGAAGWDGDVGWISAAGDTRESLSEPLALVPSEKGEASGTFSQEPPCNSPHLQIWPWKPRRIYTLFGSLVCRVIFISEKWCISKQPWWLMSYVPGKHKTNEAPPESQTPGRAHCQVVQC